MYGCPYCPQVRPSRSRLQSHINVVHSFGKTGKVVLPAAAPDVPDAAVDTAAEPLAHPNAARFAPAEPAKPKCICGDPIELMETEPGEDAWWVHVSYNTPCTDAAPASDTIRQQDRADLAKHFAETGARLAKAGEEIRDLKATADAVARRLEALDAMATSPAAVRRASLLSVWDRLMDKGDITGAQVVMQMIDMGGDW